MNTPTLHLQNSSRLLVVAALFLMGVIGLAILLWTAPSQAATLSQPTGTNIVIMVDESGSMKGNDQKGLRYRIVDGIVQYIQSKARQGADVRLAVFYFSDSVALLIPPTPAFSLAYPATGIEALVPKDKVGVGSTDFGKALEKAGSGSSADMEKRQSVIILVTDADLRRGDNVADIDLESQVRPTLDKLPQHVAQVIVFAIENPVLDQVAGKWERLPRARFIRTSGEPKDYQNELDSLIIVPTPVQPTPTLPRSTLTPTPAVSTASPTVTPTPLSATSTPTLTPVPTAIRTPVGGSSVWTIPVMLWQVVVGLFLILVLVVMVVLYSWIRRPSRAIGKMGDLNRKATSELRVGHREDAKKYCEESLQIADRYSGQMVAMEDIVQKAREAIETRIAAEEDLGDQRRVIYEMSSRNSVAVLNGLAEVLEERWEQHLAWVLEEVYGILDSGGSRHLLSFIPKALALADVFNSSEHRLNEKLPEIIARVRDSFAETEKYER